MMSPIHSKIQTELFYHLIFLKHVSKDTSLHRNLQNQSFYFDIIKSQLNIVNKLIILKKRNESKQVERNKF